jgi:beta-fructofuranosidase
VSRATSSEYHSSSSKVIVADPFPLDLSWGLASSKDLWQWEHHDPILAPEQPGEGIFSGSSVVDFNNTSGFFNDSTPASQRLVAIYTLNTPDKQQQNIAYTTDGGFTYVKYEGNPVIDRNELQFRDPKVIWHAETQKWVMGVSLSQQYSVLFYTSPDLKSWELAGNFSHVGIVSVFHSRLIFVA